MDSIYKILESLDQVEEGKHDDTGYNVRDDGPRSECCDAPLLNYNDGIGICSDCKDHAGPHKDEEVEEAEITPIDHSGDDEDGASVEDIESAITRRMMNHPKFGELIREIDIIDLNDAIEDVARFHEGGDLGSSDVSAMVNDVLKQLKKEGALSEAEVNEEDVEENAFNQAAAAAARAGKEEFEFGGKTHPVKMDKATAHKLDDDINEDEDSMPASPDEGGMAGDQIEFIKYAADEIKDHIEAGGDFPEWFQNKMSDVYGKMKDLHGYMEGDKRNDETEDEVEFELEERKLSSSEEKEMERIVTAMKDDPETVKDMKERYGKRWEEVAYATATKMAKQHGKGTGKKKKKTESTVAGAVAVGADATGSNVYGNPSVYESMNSKVENMITESMSVNVANSTEGEPTVSVSATGDDALALAQLLQLARVERPMAPCEACGEMHEGSCMNEENESNSANNTHTYDMKYLLDTISGGLNGPKRQVNPNNPGDNPLAMGGIGKDTLNMSQEVAESEDRVESHLEALYKEFKAK